MDRHDLYLDWLKTRTETPAEIMAGLRTGYEEVRLDTGGMEAVPTDRLAAGGYDEERAIYQTEAFGAGVPGVEARTIHLGFDIFAPADTPVFAPLDSTVHSFQDNAARLDYGPTILLEHVLTEDLTLWSLYGHLSRDSLSGLRHGQAIAGGKEIARLGSDAVNGGWLPHLHFQLILDIGDARGDFPGVFRKSERERWRRVCPDPRAFLQIA
ncbi:peptidoglycan DD-metalloendopeptidase family protein [Asticcacaulis solisilvae]|uniref:peptidoglycan DD-metalloendopeptidase family protein n=1 Tax=Asticcacaulis solisilvae TaxID=1217274 RepID=UPI003FD8C492